MSPGGQRYGTRESRSPHHWLGLSWPIPNSAPGPCFPPWPEDTYHVKYIGHEHLHIHEQGCTPIVWNLDSFLNLLGPAEVEEGWPG